MKRQLIVMTVAFNAMLLGSVSAQSDISQRQACDKTVFGVWDAGSGTEISIVKCSDLTPCGRITKLSDPDLPYGNNRDDALKGKPLLGRIILSGFRKSRTGWKKGVIYNPTNGKYYKSSIRLQSENQLLVKGCVGPFCEKQIWSRVGHFTCSK